MATSGNPGKRGLSKWIYRLELFGAWAACFMLAVNVSDILLGVFCRYILKSSLIWTEEVARFSLVWIVMLGALGAAIKGDHMAVDFVVPHLPLFFQRLIKQGKFYLSTAIILLMIYLGWVNATRIWYMRTLALNIPKTIPLMALPAGFALLLAGTVLLHLRERGN
jgi:TRAP-type C4-dicarboxylate transport system permease small subunit